MARSKNSSQTKNSGLLFDSDDLNSNTKQNTDDSLDKQTEQEPKKRLDAKSIKKSKVTEALDLFSSPDLLSNSFELSDETKSPLEEEVVEEQVDAKQTQTFKTPNLSTTANFSANAVITPKTDLLDEDNFQPSVDNQTDNGSFQASIPSVSNDTSVVTTGVDVVVEPKVVESPAYQPVVNISTPYQVVARRYRPQSFDELIGQENVARALSKAIETNRVGHAYLFTGARGVGKTSCARIFAKALNCVEGPTTHPCLKCDSCVGISTGEDVDVIEIDGASNRGVDEIRQLRQNAAIAPSRSNYKIYIIDEVHMLTREAFNALLKTLEEPPARVKFIFCTTEPNKIPITILSRCQRFDFNNIKGNSISSRLKQIAQLEGTDAEEGVFDVLARRANGSMRDAQSLLEQLLSFAPNVITMTDVHNMLGSVDDARIFELIDAILQGNVKRVFELLSVVVALGVDFGALVEQMFGAYRDLMVVASGCGVNELVYSPAARFDKIKEVSEKLGVRRILASLQILDQAIQRMRYSAQPRILAELAFARLCQLDAFQTIEKLIEQLKGDAVPYMSVDQFVQNSHHISETIPSENDKKKNNFEQVSKSEEKESVGLQFPSSQPLPKKTSDFTKLQSQGEEFSISSKGLWTSKSQTELADLWRKATSSGGMLTYQASAFYEVRTEIPRTFVVVFPKTAQLQRDFCEKERSSIIVKLSEILGETPILRFVVDTSIQSPSSNQDLKGISKLSNQDNGSSANAEMLQNESLEDQIGEEALTSNLPNYHELRRDVSENEVVLQIQNLFGAELSDVKPVSQSSDDFLSQDSDYE